MCVTPFHLRASNEIDAAKIVAFFNKTKHLEGSNKEFRGIEAT
jgi:hypothetical protein